MLRAAAFGSACRALPRLAQHNCALGSAQLSRLAQRRHILFSV
jgi:hypothetical protein